MTHYRSLGEPTTSGPMQKKANRRSVRHPCLTYIEFFAPHIVPVEQPTMRMLNSQNPNKPTFQYSDTSKTNLNTDPEVRNRCDILSPVVIAHFDSFWPPFPGGHSFAQN